MIRNSLLKACIDDALTICNGDHLLHTERFFPTEESRDVGRAMVEREEIERPRISRDHKQSSFFATNAASCSTWVVPVRLLYVPRSCRSSLRLLSIQSNSFWKESMNFRTPSSCSCPVSWS